MSPLFAFQLRRIARNRQYLFFTVLLPALFTIFFTKIFGGQAVDAAQYQDAAGAYMVSMMAYGAMGAALGATIRISFDRASGWLRQLRVTPVPQTQVFAVDVAVGTLLALPSLVVVALVGRFVNGVAARSRHLVRADRRALGRVGGLRRPRPADRARPGREGGRRRHRHRRHHPRRARRPVGAGRDLPGVAAGGRPRAAVLLVRRSWAGTSPRARHRRRRRCSAMAGFTAVFAVLRWSSDAGARCTRSRAEPGYGPGHGRAEAWRTLGWALPWLLFLAFPIADLVVTPRPAWQRVVAAVGLAVFTAGLPARVQPAVRSRGCEPARGALVVVVVLAVALAVWLGTAWAGLLIYVSAAAAGSLPRRWVWPAVLGRRRGLHRGGRRRRAARRRLHPAGDVPAHRLRAAGHPPPGLGQRRAGGGPRRTGAQRGRRGAAPLRPRPARPARATACR